MARARLITRLIHNRDGVAAVEFAIVAIPLFLLIVGMIEFGLLSYTQVSVESALIQSGRTATIGGGASAGCDRACYIIRLTKQKIEHLPNNNQADVTAAVVTNPGVSPTLAKDVCLLDPANPYPSSCPGAYQENTGNSTYDAPSAGNSVGASGDLVEIRVTYPWRIMTPFIGKFFEPNGVFIINSAIVVRNEPF